MFVYLTIVENKTHCIVFFSVKLATAFPTTKLDINQYNGDPISNQDTAKENLETHANESIDNSDQTENKPTNGSVDETTKLKPNGNRYERRVYKVTDKYTSPK